MIMKQIALLLSLSLVLTLFQDEAQNRNNAALIVADFDDSLTVLAIEYDDATDKLEQTYINRVDLQIAKLIDSLEDSRKAAVQKDNLDKALALQSLIEKYSAWLDDDESMEEITAAPPRTKRKEPSELLFNREVASARRERDLETKKLKDRLFRNATHLRDEAVKSLESLRMEAMKSDNLNEAKQLRDQIESLKKRDLTIPIENPKPPQQIVVAESPEKPETHDVIRPISNTQASASATIPSDVARVEAAFFYAENRTHISRSPGFRGVLRINGKRVVSYTKKYTWTDGKSYSVSTVFDGSKVDTRLESKNGSIDISSLIKPGDVVSISYGHKQQSAIGVRLLYYKKKP